MSADPAGFALVNPMERDNEGGWKPKASYSIIEAVNWYAYVSHNPVIYVDPTGEIAIVVVGGAAAVLLITALAAAGISAIILDPENQENMANAAKQIAEDAMRIAEGAKVLIDVLKAETDDVDEPSPAVEKTADAETSSGGSADPDNNDDESSNRKTNPSKSESKVWRKLDNYRDGIKRSGSGRNQRFYKWDHTHNDIEVYNHRGKHLGSMDPSTGKMYKPPAPGRTLW